MSPRATPLNVDDRRAALVDATLPLLYEHGRSVTTKLIAEAAGVAEGTIFRAFASKDELVDAALARAFDPAAFVRRLEEIDPATSLEQRLLKIVSIMQQRLLANFGLMRAMGIVGPPPGVHDNPEHVRCMAEAYNRMVALLEPDAERLTMSPDELVHVVRLLTFAASHKEIADGHLLSPQQIVDTVLHGVLKEGR